MCKFAVLACLLLLVASPAKAERRVALVIGNGAYKTAPLKNPTNDAQDMADALREMGFDVTLKLNASIRDMEEAVRAFGVKLKQGGLGLFYYAGHGVQVAGENYLIPVDTKVEAEADVKFGALNAGLALARMEDAGNDFNIVILDACRTNPFARNFRTVEQGLARMDAPKGSLIAYATAPGRVAADSGGTGRNGVYTSFLLKHMRVPGQKVEEILKRVRADVVRATKDKQVPWESSSLIGDFYFVQPSSIGPQTGAPPVVPKTQKGKTIGDILGGLFNNSDSPNKPLEKDFVSGGEPSRPTTPIHLDSQSGSSIEDSDTSVQDWFKLGKTAYGKKDNVEALKWFNKAARKGHTESQVYLGWWYASGFDEKYGPDTAAEWFRKASNSGNPSANYGLGILYLTGRGVVANKARGGELIRDAADAGHAKAQYVLSVLYKEEPGIGDNINESAKLLRKAAESGLADAQYDLGIAYATGFGVKKDDKAALLWLEKAASQGHLGAGCDIALAYVIGNSVKRDPAKAFASLRKLADMGSARAMFLLGKCYEDGIGVAKSTVDATRLWRKASDLGNMHATFELAMAYDFGNGIPADKDEAKRLYTIAANSGMADAQFALGLYTRRGAGDSPQKELTDISAYAWFTLAEEQGHDKASYIRKNMAKWLKPNAITAAKELVEQRRNKTSIVNYLASSYQDY